ncbi:MAG: homing endonuclease associated repeat-containing protein [Actinomycetota bacterium]
MNRFYKPETSARRSEIQRLRHANDPEFRKASLEILKRSREARFWSDERIIGAIRDFHAQEGRPPSYHDFRRTKELPDYATLWKRFGSIRVAISRALGDLDEQQKFSE